MLRATFPAGTLTGAPKVRAMEIIDELEPVKRGIYGGACGYLSFAGDMDVAIAIRTGVVKDGNAVRAGGGRHRRRFGARAGMAGDREQGARAAARGRAGRGGVLNAPPRSLRSLPPEGAQAFLGAARRES